MAESYDHYEQGVPAHPTTLDITPNDTNPSPASPKANPGQQTYLSSGQQRSQTTRDRGSSPHYQSDILRDGNFRAPRASKRSTPAKYTSHFFISESLDKFLKLVEDGKIKFGRDWSSKSELEQFSNDSKAKPTINSIQNATFMVPNSKKFCGVLSELTFSAPPGVQSGPGESAAHEASSHQPSTDTHSPRNSDIRLEDYKKAFRNNLYSKKRAVLNLKGDPFSFEYLLSNFLKRQSKVERNPSLIFSLTWDYTLGQFIIDIFTDVDGYQCDRMSGIRFGEISRR
ncbi:hypothetical protein BJ085DRAFT_28731 [Dimargaris cristalligena]|uniref:Uncharacterized protein n=1 Tax=Dimargaris cristalligena TaxID=215637 RepID=A0A4P9ZKZ6_9FUNG|nr:hypothetical protein BJ085DRAFT_28731 [Dimargaris cristalligena]|eukprot:RKP33793.1 hypothetical protein BJ085DRAFT_28731 [Dimargaris cristalligena]